ncbi:hypothetical protein Tther_00871 [Tepidimonas thermarum]|uniref:Uncharacterized protein n=1 Tax=Tepidimonas thermarum TaxID=335431 RepID=A0A554X459_9BURK|nr:hypothetical protein [Tepidimonas thermarum]TSE30631.1 hypothetical protein Tther_00871 [Tepidimonas thermarum]
MSTLMMQTPPAAAPTHAGAPSHVEAARRSAAPRALATLLLAAGVAALAVVTDRLVVTWADGDLLSAWVLMWAVVFAGSLLLASPARHAAQRVMAALNAWALRRALARAEARTQALARTDARLHADLQARPAPATASPADWADALSPLGPDLALDTAHATRAWALSTAEQVVMPDGRRYSLYYV